MAPEEIQPPTTASPQPPAENVAPDARAPGAAEPEAPAGKPRPKPVHIPGALVSHIPPPSPQLELFPEVTPAPPAAKEPVLGRPINIVPLSPPPPENGASTAASAKRRPLLSQAQDTASGRSTSSTGMAPVSYIAKMPRQNAAKRSRQTVGLLIMIAVCNLLVLGAAGVWFYNVMITEMEARINDAGSRAPRTPAPAPIVAPAPPAPAGVAPEKLREVEQKWNEKLAALESQEFKVRERLAEAQSQFKDTNAALAAVQAELKENGKKIELASARQVAAASAPPQSSPPVSPTLEQWKDSEDKLQTALAEQKKVIDELQKRLAESEGQLKRDAGQLKDLIVATTAAASESKPVTVVAAAIPGGVPIADDPSQTPLSPSQSELILLKERNRLTAYADEAIATASRQSYDRLGEALKDPRLTNLSFATQTEMLRVRNFYLSGSRLTKYEIPVADVFPGSATLRDVQLNDDQVIQLLQDQKQPWQTRMKSAWILGHRHSATVGDALMKTVKEDPNLDVVKEATFSFEQMTGFSVRLFEPALMEAWWKEASKDKRNADNNIAGKEKPPGKG